MTEIKRVASAARTECAAAWEEGKTLNLETVVAAISSEL